MATIKTGLGIAEIRGSVGGATFSRNASGPYVRNRSIPVNPNTDRQDEVRSMLSQVSEAWKTVCSVAQREAWDVYAASIVMKNKVGDDMYLSGFNHFCRSNMAVLLCGIAIIPDGPTELSLPVQDPQLAIACTESDQKIAVTFDDTLAWVPEVGGFLLLAQGLPQQPTREFFGSPWRIFGQVDGAVIPPTSPATLDASYIFAAGQKIWAKARILRADGRLSEPFRTDSIAVA